MDGQFGLVEPFWSADIVAQACQITGKYGPNVEKQWPILFAVSKQWGLQDRLQLASLCGVIGHETAHQWWPIHEFGSDFSRYGYSPTGQDYGGRGLIQTTWQSNYQQAQQTIENQIGLRYDLVNNPDLILNDPVLAAHAACVYWSQRDPLMRAAASRDYGEVIHYVWGANLPGNSNFDQYYKELKYAADYLLAR